MLQSFETNKPIISRAAGEILLNICFFVAMSPCLDAAVKAKSYTLNTSDGNKCLSGQSALP